REPTSETQRPARGVPRSTPHDLLGLSRSSLFRRLCSVELPVRALLFGAARFRAPRDRALGREWGTVATAAGPLPAQHSQPFPRAGVLLRRTGVDQAARLHC